MSAWQALGMFLLLLMLALGAFVGFRYLAYRLDQRFPTRVQVQPISHLDSAGKPPESWWDALEALQARYSQLQTEVKGHLTDSENNLRLARSAEERSRKLRKNKGYPEQEEEEEEVDELPPARPVTVAQGGWDDEAAPVGQPSKSRLTPEQQHRLNQRRAK